jgi:hypothetical protein
VKIQWELGSETTWEDVKDIQDNYPLFNLEVKVELIGCGIVMRPDTTCKGWKDNTTNSTKIKERKDNTTNSTKVKEGKDNTTNSAINKEQKDNITNQGVRRGNRMRKPNSRHKDYI